jgi:hypothetical protein
MGIIEYMTLSITSLYEHSATCNYTGQTVAWIKRIPIKGKTQ